MKFTPTDLPEVVLVEPVIHRDGRGTFTEIFNAAPFRAAGLPERFVQTNHSRSTRNALRGLHYQLDNPQGKLVRVIRGAIFDVAVDIRVGSPTFGAWIGQRLDDESGCMLWIPPGFAHGFCTLSDMADVVYQCTALYDAADDRGVAWSDPAIAVDWPIDDPLVSERDRRHPRLTADRTDLPRYTA